jgi:hypothetical protein
VFALHGAHPTTAAATTPHRAIGAGCRAAASPPGGIAPASKWELDAGADVTDRERPVPGHPATAARERGRRHMVLAECMDEATVEAGGHHAEVIACTLEALQARLEGADREALRGAISFHPPLAREGEDQAR